ncbi:hypothetical protein [Nostoc sp. 'Lobaria pulmonaria (5183) cyanobiont']|uniref:hypothetical protein n=1 Tax=Nostoc sp. 'Lobaria pulmonaria (5183) cyanobiont' TaxID=1618022 RepID=UPI00131A3625|nr:hypothetical protein [Nostoc sp. 'Lobaria pulmonaria (5183) cyanobiont']
MSKPSVSTSIWRLRPFVFGKAGVYYYKIARAEDDRPVEANRVRKSKINNLLR